MLRVEGILIGNKLMLKGIDTLDEDEEELIQLKPKSFSSNENVICKYFEDEEELNEWIRDYMRSGYKVRIARDYGGRAAFVTPDGLSFACSGFNKGREDENRCD